MRLFLHILNLANTNDCSVTVWLSMQFHFKKQYLLKINIIQRVNNLLKTNSQFIIQKIQLKKNHQIKISDEL